MFMPCGLGHMMGLDVHDMENLGEVYVAMTANRKALNSDASLSASDVNWNRALS